MNIGEHIFELGRNFHQISSHTIDQEGKVLSITHREERRRERLREVGILAELDIREGDFNVIKNSVVFYIIS